PLVVDVTVGPEHGDVTAPLHGDLAGFAHLYFLINMRVPQSPDVMTTTSIRLRMIWRPHPRFFPPENVFSGLGSSTACWSNPVPRSRTSTSKNSGPSSSRPTRKVKWTRS